jgi:hypothetical protein
MNLIAKAIFIGFNDFIKECKEVVKYFKNHHMDKDSFEEMQKNAGPGHTHLSLPSEVRWTGLHNMFENLIKSFEILCQYVNNLWVSKASNKKQKAAKEIIKSTIDDPSFLPNLLKCKIILDPIIDMVVEFQSDQILLSTVYHKFDTFKDKYTDLYRNKQITKEEFKSIKDIIDEYWNFVYNDATGIAYLIDPHYCGKRLN